MTKKNDTLEELAQFTQELQQVRQDSLAATRRGDFRAVARLTGEAARLNRLILAAEGSQVPVLDGLGDKLFTSHSEREEKRAPEPDLIAA
ncbi:MAG: hypothetical protein AB9869_30995 [Verrucomicrobiia bacterium]